MIFWHSVLLLCNAYLSLRRSWSMLLFNLTSFLKDSSVSAPSWTNQPSLHLLLHLTYKSTAIVLLVPIYLSVYLCNKVSKKSFNYVSANRSGLERREYRGLLLRKMAGHRKPWDIVTVTLGSMYVKEVRKQKLLKEKWIYLFSVQPNRRIGQGCKKSLPMLVIILQLIGN